MASALTDSLDHIFTQSTPPCLPLCPLRQVTNVKIALTDDKWTYEPSYNLVKKAPSLAISRPMHGGKYKFGWNLKTDDLSLEYGYKALKFVAFKSPNQPVPRVAASFEHDLEF